MANLYVWYPSDDSWGHASLLLDISQVYISWWPKDDKAKYGKKKKKVDARDKLPDDYDEDVENNGREATHRFYISEEKIYCNAVETWWERTRGSGGYHVWLQNCCDIVYAALKEGGCYDWVHPGIKVVSTPRHMIRYAGALEQATSKSNNPFDFLTIK